MEENIVLVFDIDNSIMPQGGPIDPTVAGFFRVLSKCNLLMGPATGKNCDYSRGLACGIGVIWDFVIAESGAQFLETISKGSPPAFRQRKVYDAGSDLSIFMKRIELDIYDKSFAFYDRRESFRVELKEAIITVFPPGTDIQSTEAWFDYFNSIIKTFRLRLKLHRFSDGCIDVVPISVSKRLGIDTVCQIYNCEPKNIVVVVDGVNDLELTQGTNIIAVNNAVKIIKDEAEKNNGFISSLNDGQGFIEGMKFYASKGSFSPEINKAILKFK
jgi:hydroxymethylpyrimidine pyrophosphatase-like HAD family hydrolase